MDLEGQKAKPEDTHIPRSDFTNLIGGWHGYTRAFYLTQGNYAAPCPRLGLSYLFSWTCLVKFVERRAETSSHKQQVRFTRA